jgi:hypothetical protein
VFKFRASENQGLYQPKKRRMRKKPTRTLYALVRCCCAGKAAAALGSKAGWPAARVAGACPGGIFAETTF